MLNLAIIGPSGAGKGTHATSLAAQFELHQVSTGDLFRENVRSHTALGLLARQHLERNDLVPDELVDAMIEEWSHRLPSTEGMLIDGFPRTMEQVRFLDALLLRGGRRLDGVIYLHTTDEEIGRRLSGRLICHRCQTPYHDRLNPPARGGLCDRCGGSLYRRPDDQPGLAQARLRIFHRAIEPVLDHYCAEGKLLIVSGHGSIAEVDRRLLAALTILQDGAAVFATAEERAALPRIPLDAPLPGPLARKTLDLVLLGAPGSGKGTQAAMLSQRLRLPHLATGDLFRENLRLGTELGKLAQAYMDRGELVPDGVTDAMVADRLAHADVQAGFILDGFPRTLPQAHALLDLLGHLQRRITAALYIKVPDAEIVARLSGRWICRQCQTPYHGTFNPAKIAGRCDRCGGELYQRADDTAATIHSRLATFHAQTEPLIDFYRGLGLLLEIDGAGELTAVRDRCLAALSQVAPLPAIPAGDDI